MLELLLTGWLEFKQIVCKHDIECNTLAEAVYHESRGESIVGQRAVAHVIMNRVNDKRWPDSVKAVVHQPYQFSYTIDGSKERGMNNKRAKRKSRLVAFNVLYGIKPSPVGGATHYYNPSKVSPSWSKSMNMVAEIDNHVFYE